MPVTSWLILQACKCLDLISVLRQMVLTLRLKTP